MTATTALVTQATELTVVDAVNEETVDIDCAHAVVTGPAAVSGVSETVEKMVVSAVEKMVVSAAAAPAETAAASAVDSVASVLAVAAIAELAAAVTAELAAAATAAAFDVAAVLAVLVAVAVVVAVTEAVALLVVVAVTVVVSATEAVAVLVVGAVIAALSATEAGAVLVVVAVTETDVTAAAIVVWTASVIAVRTDAAESPSVAELAAAPLVVKDFAVAYEDGVDPAVVMAPAAEYTDAAAAVADWKGGVAVVAT